MPKTAEHKPPLPDEDRRIIEIVSMGKVKMGCVFALKYFLEDNPLTLIESIDYKGNVYRIP